MILDRFGKPLEVGESAVTPQLALRPAPRAHAGPMTPAPRGPKLSRNAMLGGGAAAIAVGVLLGLAAKPDLGRRAPAVPMTPAAEEAAATPLPVVLAPVAAVATPEPQPTGKLAVLPADMAAAARAAVRPQPRPAPRVVELNVEPMAQAAEPPGTPVAAREPDFVLEPPEPLPEENPDEGWAPLDDAG